MNATSPILEIRDLYKTYGKNEAVKGISLTVPRGSFYGLLGPNGAGKSTTIGCTTGTVNITSGTITVDGIDVVQNYREARRKIGISPQDFNIDVFERVYLLMDYMGGFYGVPAELRRSRIDEIMSMFALHEHKDKRFMDLSGGLKRRVVLARALVHDPELLILDEPTAGIDVEQRRALWDYLRDLNKKGKTIILTSHYLEEIERLCDRVAIINNGVIVADGTKDEFIKDDTLEETYLKITRGETY